MSMVSDAANAAARIYPVRLNPYCEELSERSPAVHAMYYPDGRELDDYPGTDADGLGEAGQMPAPRLIRRYGDRAVLLCTGECFVHCRFCFRKRLWRDGEAQFNIGDAELDEVCAYLDGHREIIDVLLSGGDVLTLPDSRVLEIAGRVRSSGGVSCVRICSRAPAVAPSRITDELARGLGAIEGLWFVTHFDHPDELTPEAREACRRLVVHGVPVLDQTVLLAGINDDPDTLEELFRTLASWRVKPHYLFHVDPVAGVGHFATGAERGLEIMAAFRDRLSSLATPRFALDLPEGGGKVALSPDQYAPDGVYSSPVMKRKIRHPLA